MSPPGKKRPTHSGRPIARDPRSESAAPPRDPASMRPGARISVLESELARVQQERESEADDLAAMLVRIAEAERAKAAAARTAVELDELVNALRIQLRDLQARELANASEWATERATTQQRMQEAEHARAESLQQARDELDAERARGAALEAKQADALREQERKHDELATSLREEHGGVVVALKAESDQALNALEQRHAHTLSAVREEHAANKRSSARMLEEERSATARARRQATTLEVSLASMRGNVEQASELLDQLERREEMASAHRARTLEQTRLALAGGACEPPASHPPAPVAQPTVAPGPGTLDEMEIDLIE